ncbi:MAG: type II secretion system F family protein [Thermoplasmata archaeon]
MDFRIPFTLKSIDVLKNRSKPYVSLVKHKNHKLESYLKDIGLKISSIEYTSICIRNFIFSLVFLFIALTLLFFIFKVKYFYIFGPFLALAVSGFIYINQYNYPRIYSFNKSRNIERNLIPALQDLLVQLNSGVPLFSIMLNIANSDYGHVSTEFRKITNEINSGVPEMVAIEKYAVLNQSPYFKHVLWQISNGMRAGGEMEIVITESIKNLNDEQAIEIQSYGSRLNPLVMFYMIIAVILPSLGITFLIIISSLLSFSGLLVKVILIGASIFIVVMQILFIGLIKTRRPRLI